MCLQLSPVAEFYIERGLGKEDSVDKAMEVIEIGERAELVRTAWLKVQKMPTAFCQCCSCCCHGLRTVYELKIPNAVEFVTDWSASGAAEVWESPQLWKGFRYNREIRFSSDNSRLRT